MKNISKLLLTFFCIFAVMVFSVSFAFAAGSGEYYVDEGILYVKGAKNFDKLNSDSSHSDVCICDSDISNKITITNPNINNITFCRCNVKSENITLPVYLGEITFEKSSFANYSFLGSLSYLDSLTLNYINNISDLKLFKSAKTITTIKVHNCKKLHTVDGIEAFQNLDFVQITDCGIESIEPLRTLEKLDTLIMTSCDINSLEPVKNAQLTTLFLSNSVNIRNLDIVTGYNKLEILYAENLEMACSEELVSFIEKNGIKSNINRESLKYKSEIKSIYKSIIRDGMTVQQKVEKIVQYVLDHMEYDYDIINNSDLCVEYNLNGLKYALSGKGICRNYTSFITALMYEAGFVCYEVDNGEHIWNLIKIRGHFYWLDATWLDDCEWSEVQHSSFYMGGDKGFLESHENGTPVPASYNGAQNDFLTRYSRVWIVVAVSVAVIIAAVIIVRKKHINKSSCLI